MAGRDKDDNPLKEGTDTPLPKTPLQILEILRRPFPANEIKERDGGMGKKLKYVSGASVIKRVIEATDGNYTSELVWQQIIDIETKRKGQYVTVPAMLALVRVTIPGLGSKEGLGIQILEGGEDMYKGAFTDGFKKAMTQNGCALDLYETEEAAIDPMPEQTLSLIDDDLKQLLYTNGVTTQGALSKFLMKEFGTTVLTPNHIEEMRAKLSDKEKVAF